MSHSTHRRAVAAMAHVLYPRAPVITAGVLRFDCLLLVGGHYPPDDHVSHTYLMGDLHMLNCRRVMETYYQYNHDSPNVWLPCMGLPFRQELKRAMEPIHAF